MDILSQLVYTLRIAVSTHEGDASDVFTILIGKGMLWGNILGLALTAVQYFLHLIPLDAATYYVSYVPVTFPWLWLVALNLLILGVSMLTLLAPASLATRISPAKVMHFE